MNNSFLFSPIRVGFVIEISTCAGIKYESNNENNLRVTNNIMWKSNEGGKNNEITSDIRVTVLNSFFECGLVWKILKLKIKCALCYLPLPWLYLYNLITFDIDYHTKVVRFLVKQIKYRIIALAILLITFV